MPDLHQHQTPRWLNTRLRLARLTIPQWLALACGVGLGALAYALLSLLPTATALAGLWLLVRTIFCGMLAGVLCVFFYALADDRREPFLRQALGYPFRRHRLVSSCKETAHAHPRSPHSLRRLVTRLRSTRSASDTAATSADSGRDSASAL